MEKTKSKELMGNLMIDFMVMGNRLMKSRKKELTVQDVFRRVNGIASKYEGLDCVVNTDTRNGKFRRGICVVTNRVDFAYVWQSDDGDLPKLRVVPPMEYDEFMESMKPLLDFKYPPISEV